MGLTRAAPPKILVTSKGRINSFVGLLTILLSLASLELSFNREFDLNRALKNHAASTGIAAFLGGFVGIISIGRTTLNQKAGGGALSGVVAALICLAMLLGAGNVVSYIPKAALGGLVLYLGVNMLKQWLWDQRKTASNDELAQIVLILVLVANYGYLVGFVAGIVISCIIFVLTYSRIPLATLAVNLSLLTSSFIRPAHQVELIKTHGHKTVIYRLSGYIFFGSASKIDQVFQKMNLAEMEAVVLDFSAVSGIDRSAIGVFQRILRRYSVLPLQFQFVYGASTQAALLSISNDAVVSKNVSYFSTLDQALETAEDRIILRSGHAGMADECFDFLDSPTDREIFRSYCETKLVAQNEALCRHGDFSDAIYFVNSGNFEVIKELDDGATRRVAKLSTGATVGELAFYTGESRSASILCVVTSQVFILHKEALERMRGANPKLATAFDHMVIRSLAYSLARANKLITTLA